MFKRKVVEVWARGVKKIDCLNKRFLFKRKVVDVRANERGQENWLFKRESRSELVV